MSKTALLAVVAVLGCGGSEEDSRDAGDLPPAAARPDGADGAAVDAALADAAAQPLGFGVLGGDCAELDDELTSPEPSLLESTIDFERLFGDDDADLLTEGGQEILEAGNAGGSSLLSEVFAYELLARCELATLLGTETEISYDERGAITDLLVEIDGDKIGVSVTRAVAFPFDAPYGVEQAREIVERKLADILESTANVSEEDRWTKQILAILAYGPDHAVAVADALELIDPAIRADTIVWTLVTWGADDFIYCDGPCERR